MLPLTTRSPGPTGSTAPPSAAPGAGGSIGSSAACHDPHDRVGPSAASAPAARASSPRRALCVRRPSASLSWVNVRVALSRGQGPRLLQDRPPESPPFP